MGDPLLVRQSLINLIQNALRYTQKGGVLVAIRPRGAQCLLEVWDTGVGIADEEKGKIFSPYYRPELAWKIDSAGHGLGLAVVARCAKMMNVEYGRRRFREPPFVAAWLLPGGGRRSAGHFRMEKPDEYMGAGCALRCLR